MKKFLELLEFDGLSADEIRMISPLKLAYLGDSVYEVYIRTYIVNKCKSSVNELNKNAVKFVKASAQCYAAKKLQEQELLTEKEWAMVKKGRNQKTFTSPKNASLSDYRYATGFETMIGYLYLNDQVERMEEVIALAIQLIEGEKND